MSIQESEISLLSNALSKLNQNNYSLFEQDEVTGISGTEINKYFIKIDIGEVIPCPYPCDDITKCRGARYTRNYVLCSKDSEIISEISSINIFNKLKFRFDVFINELQEHLDLTAAIRKNEVFWILGDKLVDKKKFTFVFAYSNSIVRSLYRVIALRNVLTSDAIIIVSDNKEQINSPTINSLNIYVLSIGEFLRAKPEDLAKNIIASNHHVFNLWDSLKSTMKNNLSNIYSLSALMNHACSANSIEFEDGVAEKIGILFDTIIPLGKSYTGISLPDGVVFYNNESQTNVLIYDCKSFIGESFKTKSDDGQQQYYYLSLIESIADKISGYKIIGGIIVSNSFEKDIRDSIYNSAPWREICDKYKLFLIDVRAIESITTLYKKLSPAILNFFESGLLWDALLNKKISLLGDIITNDILDIYSDKINYTIVDDRMEYLDYIKMEFCLIYSLIISRNSVKTEYSMVNNAIKRQVTSKVLNTEWSPLEKDLIYLIRDKKFDEIISSSNLHPLSLLILSKGLDLRSSEVDKSFFNNNESFQKYLEDYIKSL